MADTALEAIQRVAGLAAPMRLPPDHAQRRELNDEVHARPPEPLTPPARLSYLALLSDPTQREGAWAALRDLAIRLGAPPPAPGVIHYSAEMGGFRLRWEQHTEFYRLMIVVPGADAGDPFGEAAMAVLPPDWVAALPGTVIAAVHGVLLRDGDDLDTAEPASAARFFEGNALIGSAAAGGLATVLTDLRIHADGFGRFLTQDHGMAPRQAGRLVQRLLEIDTYRIMALLALPVARDLAPFLTRCEQELAEIAASLVGAGETDEPVLLARLTRLAAEIESRQSGTRYRFSAAEAYHSLVERRIAELRETRIEGLSTFREFTERRLAPAMATCRSVVARHDSLAQRVARATQLLLTRVDLTRERQNQSLLESMNRRAKMQLRLQQTVEGLSVAAITYYIVGLVQMGAKGLVPLGMRWDPDLVAATSIPVVALVVAGGVRRVRRMVTRESN
jgi:uncharacterized membrane-anchored protein